IEDPHNWQFDKPIFNQLIPFKPQSGAYNFINTKDSRSRTARFNTKLYWILNRTNHIYPETGINYLSTNFTTSAKQKLEEGGTNSFHEAGFDNAMAFRLRDIFGGFTYKKMIGKLIMHAGALTHIYLWHVKQDKKNHKDRQKTVILPFFRAKYKMN